MKALEEKPLQSKTDQNLPSSTTDVPSLLKVANHMKNKVKVGDAAKKNTMKKSKIPKKEMAKAKPKSKPLLAKNPVYRSLSNKRRMQLTSPNQNRRVQRSMNPGLEFLQFFLHKYRAGCSKCRYREFCTRSCWYNRGFEV